MAEAQGEPGLTAAEVYEKNVVTYTTAPFAAILLEHARPQPGERALDVACGTGIVARSTAPRVGATGAVVGVDMSPGMIAFARSLPPPAGAAIDWREGNAAALPLPDDAFDLVLCQAGLQFCPDRLAALREMHRVLRPGGRVALNVWRSIEHNPGSQIIWEAIARRLNTTVAAINPAMTLGDAGELRALLESAGFMQVTITPRAYVVRQPANPQKILQILEGVAGYMPVVRALSAEERASLALTVEREIEPAFRKYIEGDQELYPMSAHIALARKL